LKYTNWNWHLHGNYELELIQKTGIGIYSGKHELELKLIRKTGIGFDSKKQELELLGKNMN
jgi:hypothetical protein